MSKFRIMVSFLCVVLFSIPLVQCNSPLMICSRYFNAVESKSGTCSLSSADKRTTAQKIADCEASVSKCNEADRQQFSDALTCVEAMKPCEGTLAGAIAFGAELTTCAGKANNTSAECKKAFFP